jgi:uncharacterized protein YndB with AHSA1/START domain
MKWIMRIIGALVGIVVLLAAIGLLLPAQFKVERSAEINAPAQKVYAMIADPREWKKWSIWNQRDPAMKVDYAGPQSGKGAKWSWQSKSEGSGAMEFTEAIENAGITYKLSFPEFGMESKGQLALSPTAKGVRVTWTNEGEMGMNPMNRWFGVFMDRMVGPDFEAGLANLKRLAEGG